MAPEFPPVAEGAFCSGVKHEFRDNACQPAHGRAG